MKRKGYKLSGQLHSHAQFQRFLTIPCSRSLTGDHAGDFRSDVRRGNKPLPKIEYDIQKWQNKERWGHRKIGRHEFVARRLGRDNGGQPHGGLDKRPLQCASKFLRVSCNRSRAGKRAFS